MSYSNASINEVEIHLINQPSIKTLSHQYQPDDEDSTASERSVREKSQIQKLEQSLFKTVEKTAHLGSSIGNGDKFVRLTNSIIKVLKSFQLIQNSKKFDKLYLELLMARRVFRWTRKYYTVKELKHLFHKLFNKHTRMEGIDIFNIFFKIYVLIADFNDYISYAMQLGIIEPQNHTQLKVNNANFYFIECVIWFTLHIYQYIQMRRKGNHTKTELRIKQLNILKYFLDSITSHNDFSRRNFTLNPKTTALLGIISSLVGLTIIWK